MRKHQSATSAKLVARIVRLCVLALVFGSACQSTTSSTPPASSSFPVVIHESGGASVTLKGQPRRIISLSPSATEMLFAIGAGSQVIAVDDQSNYPTNAPTTKLSGFQPNVEAIAGYSPDLVVASDDAAGLVNALASVNVPTLVEPAAKTLDDSYAQIQQLGTATGHRAASDALVASMRSAIAGIVGAVTKSRKRFSVYHELDDNYYSVTSQTFIGQLYTLLGLQNIADRASGTVHDYPQLSSEFIVSSSPDLVVLADTKCCHQNLQTVAARPGWSSIAAVKSGQVVGVDDDVASRWGPRVVEFLRAIAAHLAELQRASSSVAV
jgi:iron complex transport system substrate-binding protein